MPRLTNKDYIHQHKQVRRAWRQGRNGPLAKLSAEQRDLLFTYFAPTETMSSTELIQHRQEVTEALSTLPQRAGQAYKKLLPHIPISRRIPKGQRHVVVTGVLREEVDVYKLSRALIALAREQMAKEDEAA